MTEDLKRILIISTILTFIIVIIIISALLGINLKIVRFNSIKEIMAKHTEVIEAEAKLKQKENEYNDTVSKINSSKTNFDTQKAKYEAISDETINIIKEATTKEDYNIEYMWIRLGNYAKKNNLSIIMAEPGGTFTETTENSDNKNSSTKTKTTTTTTTNTNTNTNTASTNATNTTDQKAANNTANNTANTNSATTADANQTTETSTTSNTLFKIQVSGSYLNVSDFVFEVENDKALRFKLDNISMDYVSGTTIKATFNVKNLVINK